MGDMLAKMAISQLLIGLVFLIHSLTYSLGGPLTANIQNTAHSKGLAWNGLTKDRISETKYILMGPWIGGSPCRMLILRMAMSHVSVANKCLCPLSNLRNGNVSCHY